MKPRMKILDITEFPIVELIGEDGYKLLEFPAPLRKIFDEGFQALRINSKELAEAIPDYGGRTEANYSLLPHQDHHPRDTRRFLMLSQTRDTERGASTLALYPETVAKMLPDILEYFALHKEELKQSSTWEPTFEISKEQFDRCFETGDLESVVTEALGGKMDEEGRLFAYTGLLGYLIQGDASDRLLRRLFEANENDILVEEWKQPGLFIIDNSQVFHARLGGNTNLLKRNWCV